MLPRPRIQLLARLGTISVFEVDGPWIRLHVNEDFTNFGHHLRWPFIPEHEFWIDQEHTPGEQHVFLTHLVTEHRLMAQGVPYTDALDAGDRAERRERDKLDGPPPARSAIPEDIEIRQLHRRGDVAVMLVDGQRVRSWLYTDFTEGGHDLVYPWIPANRVWIDNDVIPSEREFVILHETHERGLMAQGMSYEQAHARALVVEHNARKEAS